MNKKVLRYTSLALLIIWMSLIFYFSSQTAEVSDDASDGIIATVVSVLYPDFDALKAEEKQLVVENFSAPFRKAAHFAEFLILGVISFLYFKTYSFNRKKLYPVLPFVLGSLYAVSDEVHQLFVAGRAGRLLDVFIDSSGVLLGVLILYLIFLGGDKIG